MKLLMFFAAAILVAIGTVLLVVCLPFTLLCALGVRALDTGLVLMKIRKEM